MTRQHRWLLLAMEYTGVGLAASFFGAPFKSRTSVDSYQGPKTPTLKALMIGCATE